MVEAPKPASRGLLAYHPGEDCHVNLTGDYTYLDPGYYLSQDQQLLDRPVHPTCREALDAYVVPVLMERARFARIPVPDHHLSNDHFDPPALVYPLNPFMTKHSEVWKGGHQEEISKSQTRNYTYAICVQKLPVGSKVVTFRAVLGWTMKPAHRLLAAAIWQSLRIPLARVVAIQTTIGELLLSALRPLPAETLTSREWRQLESLLTWPKGAA
jgi:hypothetical protein